MTEDIHIQHFSYGDCAKHTAISALHSVDLCRTELRARASYENIVGTAAAAPLLLHGKMGNLFLSCAVLPDFRYGAHTLEAEAAISRIRKSAICAHSLYRITIACSRIAAALGCDTYFAQFHCIFHIHPDV